MRELCQPPHHSGSRAEFSCEAISGVGEVTYLWTFNQTDITELAQFANRTEILGWGSRMVITHLQLEDSGQIGCEAANNQSVWRHQAELRQRLLSTGGVREIVNFLLMSALSCHKDTAQGTQSPLLGAFLAFGCVFVA